MKNLLTEKEINQFQKNGAIFIKGKFDLKWIEKLKIGIEKDIKIQALDLNLIQIKIISLLI